MSKQKIKVRTIKYKVEFITDTDLKEEIIERFMKALFESYKDVFKGKANKIKVERTE